MADVPLTPSEDDSHNETYGPRVGIRLSQEGADLILRRHLGQKLQSLHPIDRGYNNRSYIAKSSENKEYVIRLCGRFWTRFKTENEVATLLFIAHSPNLSQIPIPKILGFCSDRDHSGVGMEYILMERLPGEPLDNIYKSLDENTKQDIFRQAATIVASIQSQKFDKQGSFRFLPQIGDTFGLDLDLRSVGPSRIVIGPDLEVGIGPFNTVLEFYVAAAKKELGYLRECAYLKDHGDLLPRIQKFIDCLENDSDFEPRKYFDGIPFVLIHGDFDFRNILVKDGQITGLLDWEFSGSFPLDWEFFNNFEDFGGKTTEEMIFDTDGCLVRDPRGTFLSSCDDRFVQILREAGVATQCDIPAHFDRAIIHYFIYNICPWWLREPRDPVPPEWDAEKPLIRKRLEAVLNRYSV